MKKSWFAYAIIFALILALGVASNLIKGREISTSIVVSFLSSLLICIGVFAYSLQRKIFSQSTWKVIFWTTSTLSLAMNVHYLSFKTGASFIGAVFVLLALALPAYIAVYKYSYSSNGIWHA